jgi:dTDP-4-dehydrorhamnose reductase
MFRPASAPSRVPLPLLVTGITGVAGYHALSYMQSRYPGQVHGMRQAADDRLSGPGILACDAEDRDGLARLFERHGFAAVLDCAGNCALKSCELDPAMAWRINVDGPENLAAESVRHGARLVHLSVDLVFSGLRDGDYREDDPTDPVTVYGKTMVVAEERILAADPSACIPRISLPMGVSLNGHAGAIDWIASRFKKERPATLYFDEVRTPTYADCLSRLCERMLAGDLSGIYHAGATRRLSLYQIAQVINRVGGYAPDCLRGISRFEAGPIPPRAGNVSMNGEKLARALGHAPLDPWPLDDALVPMHRDWHRERPAGDEGSPQRLLQVLAMHPRRRGAHAPAGLDLAMAASRYVRA